MAKKIQKHLLNQLINDDVAPWLFKHQEQHTRTVVYVMVTIFGMDVNYRQETEIPDHPRQALHKTVREINAEAVRKLFEAKNYSEMIERIKERFHESTAYDDLLNYLNENNLI